MQNLLSAGRYDRLLGDFEVLLGMFVRHVMNGSAVAVSVCVKLTNEGH